MGNQPRVGYVLKQYPRLSETFILHELLALQNAGIPTSVFSLRAPTEGRFHPELAAYRGDVTYPGQLDKTAAADALAALAELDLSRYSEAIAMLDRLPTTRRADLLIQAAQVARAAQRGGITHLHAHFLTIASHVAYLAHLLTGLPYSVTAHAKDVYRNTIDWDLAALIADNAATIVTVCDANLAHLQTKLPNATVRRIYNGLSDPAAPAEPASREPDLILGVGRLVEKKGFDVLLDAVAQLTDQNEQVRCVLIGEGDQRAALETQAERLGIADRVTFTGSLPQSDVALWLRRARVLAAPCVVGGDGNQDALPTVLLEALAAGLPAVSTPVAGIPEIITDEEQGLLVPSDDANKFASALSRLLNDDDLWLGCSDEGPRRLASRFSRTQTIAELIDVFSASALVPA